MKSSLKKIGFLFSCLIVVSIAFARMGYACEKPRLMDNLTLVDVDGSDYRIDWTPVSAAQSYELKYILKVPEGKTLTQKELTLTSPFYVMSKGQFSPGESYALVVDVLAHCKDGKSETASAQIALKNSEPACRFDAAPPVLDRQVLSWAPIRTAQSYVMCFYTQENQIRCQDTSSSRNEIDAGHARLVSITPVCNGINGTPAFVPVIANPRSGM